MIHNKLVRDRIPEKIESRGEIAVTRILENEDYIIELEKKVVEEVDELLRDKTNEEIADVIETLYALAEARGSSIEEIEKIRLKKKEERGGFEKRIFLIETK